MGARQSRQDTEQHVNEEGEYNQTDTKRFLEAKGDPFAVVAITEPQSSGKTSSVCVSQAKETAPPYFQCQELLKEVQTPRQLVQGSGSPGWMAGNERENDFNKNISDEQSKVKFKCEELARKVLEDFRNSQELNEFTSAATKGIVTEFGRQAVSLLNRYVSRYDNEAALFDEGVRNKEREKLLSSLGKELYWAYLTTLNHHKAAALKKFDEGVESVLRKNLQLIFCPKAVMSTIKNCVELAMSQFDEGAADAEVPKMSWDALQIRANLKTEIDDKVKRYESKMSSRRQAKLTQIGVGAALFVAKLVFDPFGILGVTDFFPDVTEFFPDPSESQNGD